MEYSLKHQFDLGNSDLVELTDQIVRIRWSKDNSVFNRYDCVTLKIPRGSKKVYRLIRGASVESIDNDVALVSYNTFKSLGAKSGDRGIIKPSTFLERNICFYFDNPDPSVRRSIVRDFIISCAGFIVSVVEIIRSFKCGF
jgi:uncharacterized protein (UPF0248 family)